MEGWLYLELNFKNRKLKRKKKHRFENIIIFDKKEFATLIKSLLRNYKRSCIFVFEFLNNNFWTLHGILFY